MKEYNGMYVTLMLNSDCNNNCAHCYINYNGMFNDEELKDLVPTLLKKYRVLFNGTEPILHDEYLKYYKMANNNIIMTNGIALVEDNGLICKLKENGINQIALSYHYGIQDEISQIKIKELDKLILKLKKQGFKVKLMCSISRDNLKCIEACCEKAYNLGVDYVRFTNFIDQGRAISNIESKKFLTLEEIYYVLDEIKEQRKKYARDKLYIERCGSFGNGINKNNFKCMFANNMVAITPDHNVYGCIFDTSIGNEIGRLENGKILIRDDVDDSKDYCKILKKYNNIR